jgi:RNA polymerase-interacting CarD/CdnL/TRCF family regulator
MFKVGEVVIYPRYGKTVVSKVYKEGKVNYYKFQVQDGLTTSLPVEDAEKFGVRYPQSGPALRKTLKKLGSSVEIKDGNPLKLVEVVRKYMSKGTTEDVINAFNLLLSLSKARQQENKKLTSIENEYLKNAQDFIKSEIEQVLGGDAVEEYSFVSF